MRVDLFDFDLPQERIALRPLKPSHDALLLEVNPKSQKFSDHQVKDLPTLLRPGDVLVFNNTRVIPARLVGRRIGRGNTAPKIEVTLHKKVEENIWLAFAKPGKKLQIGDQIAFGEKDELLANIERKGEGGEITLSFSVSQFGFEDDLNKVGEMPLPPYIASKRKPDENDLSDYQTLFATKSGAVAAPTAGLHFTDDLIHSLDEKGIFRKQLTLHVGAGTFLPVKAEDTQDHKMHSEWGEVSQDVATELNQIRKNGGRIIAVGTTSLRLLESAASDNGQITPFKNDTDIFITPGYKFKAVDLLLTNFHLPKSTLFMLVSAFSGMEMMQKAYTYAIEKKYRFYSYGDASLLHLAKD